MDDAKDIEYKDAFYRQLLSKAWVTIAIVTGLAFLGLWLVPIYRACSKSKARVLCQDGQVQHEQCRPYPGFGGVP